jgi:alpha-L-fucosidase
MSNRNITRRSVVLTAIAAGLTPLSAGSAPEGLANGGFASGALAPWRVTAGTADVRHGQPQDGNFAVALGPGPSSVEQTITVRPGSRYRLTGSLKSGSGAEEIRLGVREYGGAPQEIATALVSFRDIVVEFITGPTDRRAVVFLFHPTGNATALATGLRLDYVGAADIKLTADAVAPIVPRVPKVDLGIEQQSSETLRWLQDAKFGMFIHWGLYSGPGKGEWYMHNAAVMPDEYRKLSTPESGDDYFAADKYDPAHWAEVAKAAGMKWTCLTARHHDGFCLFDSPHPNAFTSMQTLKRDLFAEYVHAVRESGLHVGVYYSPLSWRYPGYYDVTGTDCKPNPFGYKTDPAHHENARLMKEENYVNVRKLMSAYGEIDYIFWDGGWLAEHGTDADGAYFHEPGRFLDPANPWPVGANYIEHDRSGRALGIMGMVREHQPRVIANSRYGWIGDLRDEEGGAAVIGPIRNADAWEKCLTMHGGGWGYGRAAIERGDVFSRDKIIDYLVNCVVRNMVMLLNFGPDRHGQMPPIIEERLRATGAWLAKVGESIYGTRGGPWQPKDGEYGFCSKGKTVYAHLLHGYTGNTFSLPPVGNLRPMRVYDVFTGKPLPFTLNADRTILISGIDRATNPADSVVAVQFDRDVALKSAV